MPRKQLSNVNPNDARNRDEKSDRRTNRQIFTGFYKDWGEAVFSDALFEMYPEFLRQAAYTPLTPRGQCQNG